MQLYYKEAPVLVQKKPSTSVTSLYSQLGWATVVMSLILLGILFRLYHFFDNRSLWLDEIYLASSIVNMDMLQLASAQLEYEQKAPIGFLWMCKLAVILFGKNEMALRLFPLICGFLSLFIFLPVARYFLKSSGVAVAIGILALAPPLVYHAVEIKQYSTELLATIMCLYFYIHFHSKQAYPQLMTWGLLGSLVIWFSFTSIFILAGMAIGICLYHLFKKEWKTFFRLLIPCSMWMVSFGVNYIFFTSKHAADSEWLVHFFRLREGFMPFPPQSLSDLLWPLQMAGTRLLHFPLGLLWDVSSVENHALQYVLRRPIFPIICTMVGVYYFYKRDKKFLLVLLVPYVLALVASALEVYPMFERLTVFLAPIFILFIALGCEHIIRFSSMYISKWAFVLLALLLAPPLYASTKQAIDPSEFGGYKKAYHRESLLLINEHLREGDEVYVYWNMLTPYKFYKDMYGLKYNAIEGSDFRLESSNTAEYFNKLDPELKNLKKAKRVWLLYSTTRAIKIGEYDKHPSWYYMEVLGGKKLYNKFSKMGTETFRYEAPALRVFLFEIKKTN